jgi:hypothetical protein
MLWLRRYWPIILGLLYLVSPIDALPDTILGLGWGDDILLLLLAYWFYKRAMSGTYQQQGSYSSGNSGQEEASSSATSEGMKDPYEVLGVSREATPEEIKSAYRRQAQRYHPDRVSHLGDEFQQLAKEKFQEIQSAYESLSREAN